MSTNVLALPLLAVDFEAGTNEDWLDALAFYQADGTTPIGIAGIAFHMQLRAKPEDRTALVDASTSNSKLLTGGTLGNVLSLNIVASQMSGLTPGAYVYDLVASADGHARRVASGMVTIIRGVTR